MQERRLDQIVTGTIALVRKGRPDEDPDSYPTRLGPGVEIHLDGTLSSHDALDRLVAELTWYANAAWGEPPSEDGCDDDDDGDTFELLARGVRRHLREIGKAFEALVPEAFPDAVSCRYTAEGHAYGDSFVRDISRAKFTVRIPQHGAIRKYGFMLELENDFEAFLEPHAVARAIIAAFESSVAHHACLAPGEPPFPFRYPQAI